MKTLNELKANDRRAVDEFRGRIVDFLGGRLCSLRLFGSKVAGTDQEGSDIDIFIVTREVDAVVKSGILDIAFDINLKYGVYISPRVVSLELFKNSAFHATPFIQNVEKDNLVL